MRKLIVSNLLSLDGFSEGPRKELDWFVIDGEFLQYSKDILTEADTLLFGRRTYEHMASYWPTAPADEIAEKMNNLPKVVFSKTLQKVDWNNSRLVKGDAAEEVRRLKELPGEGLFLGSPTVTSCLLQEGLVDEYRMILQPVLLGGGSPLFRGITERIPMRLVTAKVFASGVVALSYQRA